MANWWDSLIPSAGVNIGGSPYAGGAPAGISGLSQYNLGGQNLQQFQNLTEQGVNNPFAGGYQQGAGVAGQMGQQAGQGTFGYGSGLQQQGAGLSGDVQSLLAMGFDPQSALYARTQQQVQDQASAAAAASGVGGTPYGQGNVGQTLSNFNIDWQNQQLGRASQGAQAAGGLAQTGAGLIGAGTQQQNAGIGQYMQGSALPYQTYAGINQNQLGLLSGANTYGQGAAAIPQMQNQDQLQYMQQQGQFQNQQQALQLQQAQQEFQQAQTLGSDLGSAIGGGFGMGGMGQGGSGFNMNFGGGGGQGGGMGGSGGFAGFGQFGNWGQQQLGNLGGGFGGYPGFGMPYQPQGTP